MLFNSYTFKRSGKILKNRIALAPMTNLQSNVDGTLSKDEFKWLQRRAKENFGMVISCATHVREDGQGWPGELGIFSDNHIPGWKRIAEALKEENCISIAQLFHGGARSPESTTGKQPWSASAHTMEESGKTIHIREASENEIINTIDAFVNAAIRIEKAGLDGIELHGAHGYLIHQFLSSHTNKRTDKWGKDKTLFLRTIITKIRAAVSDAFIVGIRLSPEDKWTFQGIDIDECAAWCNEFINVGVDFIHLSPWDSFKKPEKYPDSDESLISFFRKKIPGHIPIIVAGMIRNGNDAEKALEMGADICAIGRTAIPYANWPELAANKNWSPNKPPYSVQQLKDADLGNAFIEYMKGWKGFVSPE